MRYALMITALLGCASGLLLRCGDTDYDFRPTAVSGLHHDAAKDAYVLLTDPAQLPDYVEHGGKQYYRQLVYCASRESPEEDSHALYLQQVNGKIKWCPMGFEAFGQSDSNEGYFQSTADRILMSVQGRDAILYPATASTKIFDHVHMSSNRICEFANVKRDDGEFSFANYKIVLEGDYEYKNLKQVLSIGDQKEKYHFFARHLALEVRALEHGLNIICEEERGCYYRFNDLNVYPLLLKPYRKSEKPNLSVYLDQAATDPQTVKVNRALQKIADRAVDAITSDPDFPRHKERPEVSTLVRTAEALAAHFGDAKSNDKVDLLCAKVADLDDAQKRGQALQDLDKAAAEQKSADPQQGTPQGSQKPGAPQEPKTVSEKETGTPGWVWGVLGGAAVLIVIAVVFVLMKK